jgi:Family of unknown function (DUF6011)
MTYDTNFQTANPSNEPRREVQSIWTPQDIPPIPLLRELNDWVIKQNEKRLPKWKFRFAGDLAIQVHSRLTRAHDLLLECVALQTENVSAGHFLKPATLRGLRYWRLGFKLSAETPDAAEWKFQPTSGARARDCPRTGYVDLRHRVVAALHPDRFAELHPDRMLSPNCLCCGKGLTDPVSMARWIGPECFGSASTNLSRIFKAMAPEGAP